MKSGRVYFLVFMGLSYCCFAQVSVKDSAVNASLVPIGYSYNWPGGDMVKRFGDNSLVGGGYWFKSKKNWIIGFTGNYIFGGDVKENNVLDGLMTENGFIIGEQGEPAVTDMFERGWMFVASVGKVISSVGASGFKLGPNPNSGLFMLFGAGTLQHKIRIESDAFQLNKEFTRGYDRLSSGPCITQFLGYMHLSNNRLVNFYCGIESVQAWTKNRRGFNYDTMQNDNESRMDIFSGVRIGWILPLYKKVPDEFYYL